MAEIAGQGALTDAQIEKLTHETEDAVLAFVRENGPVMRLLEDSYLYRDDFVASSEGTAYRVGQRSVVIGLMETAMAALKRQAVEAAQIEGRKVNVQTHAETDEEIL